MLTHEFEMDGEKYAIHRLGRERRRVKRPPKRKRPFVTVYLDVWPRLIEAGFFTAQEKALLMTVIPLLEWNTNLVLASGHPAQQADLIRLMGTTKNTLRKTLDGLERKGVLRFKRSGHAKRIYLNPSLVLKGNAIDPVTEKLFSGVQVQA